MFAIPMTPSPHIRQQYSPSSSPLTPRSANAQRPTSTPAYKQHSMAMTMPVTPPITPPFASAYTGQRRVDLPITGPRLSTGTNYRRLMNPLLRNGETRQEERRERFLGGVRQRREEVMWGTRGDQILQLDFLKSQRRWEAERARTAPPLVEETGADVDIEMDRASESARPATLYSSQTVQHTQPHGYLSNHDAASSVTIEDPQYDDETNDEIDAFLQAEAQELEELVALHERQRQDAQHPELWQQQASKDFGQRHMTSSPVYGSENDEDFEAALVEVACTVTNRDEPEAGGGDDMDMT